MILPTASHTKDPISSHIAEEQHKPKRVKNITLVYNILKVSDKPLTSRELYYFAEGIFKAHKVDKYEVARRLSDLKRLDRVRSQGVRKCRISDKLMGTYSTPEQRELF